MQRNLWWSSEKKIEPFWMKKMPHAYFEYLVDKEMHQIIIITPLFQNYSHFSEKFYSAGVNFAFGSRKPACVIIVPQVKTLDSFMKQAKNLKLIESSSRDQSDTEHEQGSSNRWTDALKELLSKAAPTSIVVHSIFYGKSIQMQYN